MDDQPSDEPSAPTAAYAYPRWILLEYSQGSGDLDAKTVAHARTSKGRPISVSLVLAAPPAVSRLRLHSPGLPNKVYIRSLALAAHGDSVLVNIETASHGGGRNDIFASDDYFHYCAGDAAAKPPRLPSLSLLPPCYLTKQDEWKPKVTRYMDNDGTAILRRGQDDVLVADLDCSVRHYLRGVLPCLHHHDMGAQDGRHDGVGVVDCDELWSLPGYHSVVPHMKPEYPTVSLDDPDVICFVVNKNMYHKGVDGDLGTWLIELDTRRMELRSICNYDLKFYNWPHFTASSISQYFDASSGRRTLPERKETDLEATAKPSRLSLPKVVSHEKMLATLREIPNLARDDMLKAYEVLASDKSQFKFRSLLAPGAELRCCSLVHMH
ncbi:unnamed protein product [Alopecurus aequalis]